MLDPYPVFPVFAFLGFVVGLIPFPWHLQSWNAGTCIYMLWASLASLIQFIGAVVWRNEAIEVAPIWCDIATKFIIGAGTGIPAASLCINRRLYNIATMQKVMITKSDKRRDVIVDLCIGVGIPVIVMALHYIVQGHRFNVLQEIGCVPDIYNTLPAYFLVFMWPIVLGSISFVYGGLTLRAFWVRRLQFSEFISTRSSLTVSRYFRLMLLASTDMACTIPLGIFSIYINTHGLTLAPWVSLWDTHYDFSHVELVPAFVWRSNPTFETAQEMGRWIYPVCCFVFFLLFGFADEARKHYRLAFWAVAKPFGFQPKKSALSSKFSASLPVFPPPYSPTKYDPDAKEIKDVTLSISTTVIVDDAVSMTMRSTFLSLDPSRSPTPSLSPPPSPTSSTDYDLSPMTPPSAYTTHKPAPLDIPEPAVASPDDDDYSDEDYDDDDLDSKFADVPLTPAPPKLPRMSSLDDHRSFAQVARAHLEEVYERESAYCPSPTVTVPPTPSLSMMSNPFDLEPASPSSRISLASASALPATPNTFGLPRSPRSPAPAVQRRSRSHSRSRAATPEPDLPPTPRSPSPDPVVRNILADRSVVYYHRPLILAASFPLPPASSTRLGWVNGLRDDDTMEHRDASNIV